MTVQIIETIGGAVAAAGTGSPVVTTSLLATDRVVVVVSKQSTSGTPSVSGLGGTWTNHVANTAAQDLYIISTAGVTGGGTLTILGYSSAGDYVVYVLRSSIATTPYLTSGTSNNVTGATAGTLVSLSAVAVSAGGLVIAAGSVSNGTMDFPQASSDPAGGWTTDRTGSNAGKFIHQSFGADDTVALSLTSSGVFSGALGRAVYFDDDVASPLTSTFVGWGSPIF